jgi:hypothetical protein
MNDLTGTVSLVVKHLLVIYVYVENLGFHSQSR